MQALQEKVPVCGELSAELSQRAVSVCVPGPVISIEKLESLEMLIIQQASHFTSSHLHYNFITFLQIIPVTFDTEVFICKT